MAASAPPPTGLPAASVTHWTGLYRSVDPFAIAPGAMAIADNVVVSDPSVLGPRRGFKGVTATADWAALGNRRRCGRRPVLRERIRRSTGRIGYSSE
jgi:hypothetical protein